MSALTLESITGRPMDNVMDYLNLPTISSLRKVSKHFKLEVDKSTDDFKLKIVKIKIMNSIVSLTVAGFAKKFEKRYSSQENEENFLTNFANAFKQVMSFEPAYPIEFIYQLREETEPFHPAVLNHVVTGIEETRGVLQSTRLGLLFISMQEEDIIQLLNLMDADTIKELIIIQHGERSHIIQNLCRQQNWTRLQFLIAPQSFFRGDKSDLHSLSLASIYVEDITMDWIKDFLQTLLTTDSAGKFYYSMRYFQFADRENLDLEFGPPAIIENKHQWTIKPESQESDFFIRFEHDSTMKCVDFIIVLTWNH